MKGRTKNQGQPHRASIPCPVGEVLQRAADFLGVAVLLDSSLKQCADDQSHLRHVKSQNPAEAVTSTLTALGELEKHCRKSTRSWTEARDSNGDPEPTEHLDAHPVAPTKKGL